MACVKGHQGRHVCASRCFSYDQRRIAIVDQDDIDQESADTSVPVVKGVDLLETSVKDCRPLKRVEFRGIEPFNQPCHLIPDFLGRRGVNFFFLAIYYVGKCLVAFSRVYVLHQDTMDAYYILVVYAESFLQYEFNDAS